MATEPRLNASKAEAFLLHEYDQFAELFRWNEETGEKRLTFFVTLVAAVITALVTLATASNPLPTVVRYYVSLSALLALLLLGLLLLFRMIHRRRVTDEYKTAMDIIRAQFQDLFPKPYDPLGKGPLCSLELDLGGTSSTPPQTDSDESEVLKKLREQLVSVNVEPLPGLRVKTVQPCKEFEIRTGIWNRILIYRIKSGMPADCIRKEGKEAKKDNRFTVRQVAYRGFPSGSLVEVVQLLNVLIVAASLVLLPAGPPPETYK